MEPALWSSTGAGSIFSTIRVAFFPLFPTFSFFCYIFARKYVKNNGKNNLRPYRQVKKIGIISDTHAFWDEKYLHYFEPCDEIWHAGDIGSTEVADRLAAFRTLRAVCGNCDGGDLRLMFPERLRFKCEDVDVLMKHIGGYPGNYDASVRGQIYASPPQLFISGHSHILKVKYDKTLNLLHINPGAAGIQGWHKERTIVRLTIEGQRFSDCEVVTLA